MRESLLELQCPVNADDVEAALFRSSDNLCGNMEPSDYKHFARALIYLGRSGSGSNGRKAVIRFKPLNVVISCQIVGISQR